MLRSLLAIICPPLAVLASGTRTQVVLNTGLTLLLFIPGIIHALSIVDQYNVERRYENVMRALTQSAA
jgi:uncharacterized membrane protein YqaE (UPF0057 family)